MIELKNVTKYYGNFCALNGITLSVNAGEVIGLLGPNGAGKTTAMRIITCFLPATSGTISVAGYDVFEDSYEVRRRLGYLPETPPLYPEMTVGSYLNFIADIKEVPSAKKRSRIADALARTGIGDHVNRVIGTLSKGYRQRIGLAQALVHDPEVLILDEPTVGLDPNQIIEIRNLIRDLAKDHTIVLSTHILSEVSMTCSRVVIINEGLIVAADTIENMQHKTDLTALSMCIKPACDDWKACLSHLPGWQACGESFAEGRVRFSLRLDEASIYDELFRALSGAGHVIYEVSPERTSLEQVFLRLTKKEGNDYDTGEMKQ